MLCEGGESRCGYEILDHAGTLLFIYLFFWLFFLRHCTAEYPYQGVGESDNEVETTLRDLKAAGVEIVTLGQYLRPSKRHMKVEEYVPPEKFQHWKKVGEEIGFAYVASGPLVRAEIFLGCELC